MAVDYQRYHKYTVRVEEMMDDISFEEGLARFQAKVVELARLGDLDPTSQRDLVKQIGKVMDPEFAQYAGQITGYYEELINAANHHYKDLGEDIHRQLDRIQAIERINAARLGAFNRATTKRITRYVRKSLLAGVDHRELAKVLNKRTALPQAQAETLGKTQVKGYSNALKSEKARIANVTYFEYVGFRFENTREFCQALLGHTFHIDDIRQMDNGQISPVMIYRGGYNCRHDWEADPFADKESVPTGSWTEQGLDKNGKRTLKYFQPDKPGRAMPEQIQSLPAALDHHERMIRDRKTEKVICLNDAGKIVFQKVGHKSGIDIPESAFKLFKDQVITHNHPVDCSFTREDFVRFAWDGNVHELRMTSAINRYSMQRPASGWPNRKTFYESYQKHDSEVYKLLRKRMIDRKIAQQDIEKMQDHEIWTRVSKDLGLHYKREKWNDQD